MGADCVFLIFVILSIRIYFSSQLPKVVKMIKNSKNDKY
jgi:hypothetical protein